LVLEFLSLSLFIPLFIITFVPQLLAWRLTLICIIKFCLLCPKLAKNMHRTTFVSDNAFYGIFIKFSTLQKYKIIKFLMLTNVASTFLYVSNAFLT